MYLLKSYIVIILLAIIFRFFHLMHINLIYNNKQNN